jgi:hypothetical protein
MAVLNAPPKTKIGGNAMKKVEITKSCSGVRFAFQQGEVVDIDDRLADDLIHAQFAVETEKNAESESAADVETSTAEEKKTAKRRRTTKKDVQDDVG